MADVQSFFKWKQFPFVPKKEEEKHNMRKIIMINWLIKKQVNLF